MSDVKRAIGDVVKKGGGGSVGALSASECTVAAAATLLNPFGTSDKDGRADRSNQGANGTGGGRVGKKLPTVRLELNLFEPTADSFPEFNFSKLIHEEQKRLKKAQKKQIDRTTNGFLSDPDIDVEVERVAQELERKYGMGSEYATKGKTARPSKLDYYDRGAGYDEEDSFIDNSEAYDELIPQEVETVGGGFYINSGQLEFKQLSNFERPEDAHRMPKPKKRALSTSSESSDDEEPGGAKKKPTQSVPAVQQAQKEPVEKSATTADGQQNRSLPVENEKGNVVVVVTVPNEPTVTAAPEEEKLRLNGHVAKKQKMVDNGPVGVDQKTKPSTGGGGEGGKEKTNGVKGKSAASTGAATGVVTPAVATVDGGKKEENGGVKELKTTTVKDMLRAKRDSLRKMEQEKKGRSSGSSRVSSSEAEEDGDGGGDEEDEDEENGEGDDEDEDEEEEEEEYDGQEVGSDKNSRESVSDVEMVSDSGSSHGSEKDAAAKGKVVQPVSSVATNGTLDNEGRAVLAPSGQQPPKERKQKDCKLPDDIPEQLRNDVEALKEHARAQTGKLNFFESKVADLLLRIDEAARSGTGSSTRNAIFRHLEAQLSISRQSLQLKLKKIRIRKLENKTKSVLSKLEDAITVTMPMVIAKHQLDCSKVNELRAAAAAAQAANTTLPNGEKPDVQPNNTPTTQIRNPKKKFSWNERTRTLLWELYNIRLLAFGLVRPRNQTEEEVVAEFMRTKVVPMWPKGWIRYEDIHKELDRRKKALAKSQGSSAAIATQNATGKKSTPTTVSPLISPGTAIDATLLIGVNGMKSQDIYTPARSSTPSSVKSTHSKGGIGGDGERAGSVSNTTHHSPTTTTPMVQQPGANACMSPNSSFKRTSDHSIINIMNSPPPPADKQSGEQRRSFDAVEPSVVAESLKRSPATPATVNLLPGERRLPLPSPDRPRWNSREDDSDSSIEIIAEYNVPRAGTAMPFQAGTGSKLPATSPVHQRVATALLPGAATNLPVLNKEKYKNLIAGKNKTHGGSGSSAGSSPIAAGDTVSATMGSGKYAKHSPGGHVPGGVIGFAAPSGNVSGSIPGLLPEMTSGAGGGGSVRLKDTPPPIDVDVHQIMKDLKELQELQKQHNVGGGGNRKSDNTSLQSQQQHAAAPTTSTVPAAASSNVVADYFIDCDMDEDDILFATNYTYSGGHKS